MTTTELLALFRTEVFDLEAPYLWSDAWAYGAIDAAQKQFCRDTYGIADARSFKVLVKADGTEWYALDPRILKIRAATDSVTGVPVPIVPVEKMIEQRMKFDGHQGPLSALISGLEADTLRAWPKPNVASTVELRTFRLPVDVAAGDDFEIAPQHHRYLTYWVKHLAYGIQDTETYDPKAEAKYRAQHDAYCARAKDEQSRAMHPVGTVIYGGI